MFLELFKPVMARVMETYRPGAVVLQCGARPEFSSAVRGQGLPELKPRDRVKTTSFDSPSTARSSGRRMNIHQLAASSGCHLGSLTLHGRYVQRLLT